MIDNGQERERRIILQGNPTEEQLRNLSEFAIEAGLRMVTFSKRDEITAGSQEQQTDLEISTSTEPIAPSLAIPELQSQIRRTVTRFSFQKFGYDKFVDTETDIYTQRAQKGAVSGIWTVLAKARYEDISRDEIKKSVVRPGYNVPVPLNPEPILGVNLPDFEHVPRKKETLKGFGYDSPYNGIEIEYIDTENCDDLDIDGLANYLVAVAGRVSELHECVGLKSRQTMSKLKQFIPVGLGMPRLHILAEYCKAMFVGDTESDGDQEALHEAANTFARLSNQ